MPAGRDGPQVSGISSSHSTRDLLGVPITECPQASESASGVGFPHLLEARARTCSQKARSSSLSWVWTPEAQDHTCKALLCAHPCLLGISGALRYKSSPNALVGSVLLPLLSLRWQNMWLPSSCNSCAMVSFTWMSTVVGNVSFKGSDLSLTWNTVA